MMTRINKEELSCFSVELAIKFRRLNAGREGWMKRNLLRHSMTGALLKESELSFVIRFILLRLIGNKNTD